MKSVTLAVLSSVLTMAPYNFAMAKASNGADIHVTAKQTELKDWTRRTGKLLSDQLRYPVILAGPQQGVVTVKFMCSDTGAPSHVALLKSSGSSRLDAAAIRGVSRIKTLHPLPTGLGPSQHYAATILFATDQGSYVRQIRQLENRQHEGNQWFDQSGASVAMGIGLLGEDGRIATFN